MCNEGLSVVNKLSAHFALQLCVHLPQGEKSPSLEETADLSMSEAPDESAFPGDFERHLSVVSEGVTV